MHRECRPLYFFRHRMRIVVLQQYAKGWQTKHYSRGGHNTKCCWHWIPWWCNVRLLIFYDPTRPWAESCPASELPGTYMVLAIKCTSTLCLPAWSLAGHSEFKIHPQNNTLKKIISFSFIVSEQRLAHIHTALLNVWLKLSWYPPGRHLMVLQNIINYVVHPATINIH